MLSLYQWVPALKWHADGVGVVNLSYVILPFYCVFCIVAHAVIAIISIAVSYEF